jgi:hypothetical protein
MCSCVVCTVYSVERAVKRKAVASTRGAHARAAPRCQGARPPGRADGPSGASAEGAERERVSSYNFIWPNRGCVEQAWPNNAVGLRRACGAARVPHKKCMTLRRAHLARVHHSACVPTERQSLDQILGDILQKEATVFA